MHETKTVYKNGKHILNEATTVITAERLTASIALPSIHCSSVHMFLVWFVVCCCVFFSLLPNAAAFIIVFVAYNISARAILVLFSAR